jgi:hypothetical protein
MNYAFFPTNLSKRLSISPNIFYRAEMLEDGKIIARLRGRNNLKASLDEFIATYWKYPLKSEKVETWHDCILTLRIWKYLDYRMSPLLYEIVIPKPVETDDPLDIADLVDLFN